MNPCRNALYVSLIIRCDSAAIVSNTSELLPEPDTPVNTVSRRLGSSTLTSLRLFSRAPCTRITSWLSAARGEAGCWSVLVALLIVLHPVGRSRPRGLRRRSRHGPTGCCGPARPSSVVGAVEAVVRHPPERVFPSGCSAKARLGVHRPLALLHS